MRFFEKKWNKQVWKHEKDRIFLEKNKKISEIQISSFLKSRVCSETRKTFFQKHEKLCFFFRKNFVFPKYEKSNFFWNIKNQVFLKIRKINFLFRNMKYQFYFWKRKKKLYVKYLNIFKLVIWMNGYIHVLK